MLIGPVLPMVNVWTLPTMGSASRPAWVRDGTPHAPGARVHIGPNALQRASASNHDGGGLSPTRHRADLEHDVFLSEKGP